MRFVIGIWMVLGCLVADGQVPFMLKFDRENILVTGLNLKSYTVDPVSETEWKRILSVYTREAWIKNINQPITGTWLIEGDDIVFKPHFSFSPGETYHAIFNGHAFYQHVSGVPALTPGKLEFTFTLPQPEFIRTSIDAVYPASEIVPENLLRVYIYFSSPMMPGEAYDHIKLLRADGSEVEKPFLIVDQELWDAARKRFTLLFDPGRIKRTLKSNLELGTPLKEGEKYQLVIDSTWRDINGNYLQKSFTKEFTVAAAQRTKLSKERLSVVSPNTNTREDVVLSFDRPIDHVLMSEYVSVTHSSTGDVRGAGRMIDDFTWTFTPDQEWVSGAYEVAISPWVEDVCGNNFNNVFDLDLRKEKRISSETVIKFSFVAKAMDQ